VIISPTEFHVRREVRAASIRRGMRPGSARPAERAAGMAVRTGCNFHDACNAGVAIIDDLLTGAATAPRPYARQEPAPLTLIGCGRDTESF